MEYAFPSSIRIRSLRARIEGARLGTFTNIDGEPFNRPSLNAHWRVEMTMLSADEDSHLALTGFLAAMRGHATTMLPMSTPWLPSGADGRRLHIAADAPAYRTDHMGFGAAPFEGFRLIAPARRRHSFIDVSHPELSRLRPGHRITLGDRLHQIVNVSAIDESGAQSRVSLTPLVRGDHDTGTVVVVDRLRLRAQMQQADDPEDWNVPHAVVNAVFIEAFR